MLVILYVVSAASGVFSLIFIRKENFKHWFFTTLIAILTGIAFCFSMFNKIANNVIDLNFGSVFSILSLIAWQAAFLLGNYEDLFDYECSFALLACTICLIGPSIIQPYSRATCTTLHITKEVIPIITTLDTSENDENVYGNGFIVCRVFNSFSSSRNSNYLYYYQLEDGTPSEGSVPVSSTEIEFIGPDESPYLEITIIRNCLGYDPKTGIHALGFAEKSYKLYIPENSILNIWG